MSSEKTISIFSRPRAQNGFDYFCRDLRVTKNILREACVAATLRVARHKAQRNFFKKEAIYGLFFELQLLVANFSTPLGGLFARLLVS